VTAPLLVLLLTLVGISVQRLPRVPLDRPASALTGAVLMVLVGGLDVEEAIAAIHLDTILLIFGMLVVVSYVEAAGLFARLAHETVSRARSARRLLVALVLVSGALSALLVNDTVCLVFAPFVLAVARRARLRPLPLLMAVGMASNVGGVATYTGTPQTMVIGVMSGLPYLHYACVMAPVAFLCLVVLTAMLLWFFRRDLPPGPLPPLDEPTPPIDRNLALRIVVVLIGVVVAFAFGVRLAGAAVAGAAAAILVGGRRPREVLQRIDWPLLVFFAALFVVVAGVGKAGVAEAAWRALAPRLGEAEGTRLLGFGAFTALASNLVSNVPFVLLASHWIDRFADPRLAWMVLALASTLAGNLTIVGSVANLIVLEAAREEGGMGFFTFLRYGVPVTVVTLVVGAAALVSCLAVLPQG
jgi:Na+/H+ antiporter NhaD/arsenite permease-like protein